MARKIIDIGAVGNDGTGDSIRDSFSKVNDNFLELYSSLGLGERLKFTGLSDAPTSYVGQEGALVTVNQTTTGLKFKQLVPGVGISVDQTSNPNEIRLNAIFSAISADRYPQLGGNLSATSGGNQYRIVDLTTPVASGEAANKGYVDSKIARAGINAIDPATGEVNEAFGRMTGPLILSRNPQPEDDQTYDGLIAATKSYVDSSAFGSVANLYVATSGADARPGVSDELQGRALAYAYRTIEAALKRAEELVNESRVEIGPYKKLLTYNNGAGTCTLSNISISNDSGSGFVGAALMSVDKITINAPGSNYWVGDIITLDGGTVASGGQPCKIQVLSTASTPGSLITFKILSSGVYSAIPGNLSVASTASNTTKVTFGAGATFDVTYKVNNIAISNGGSGFGLVSVRITGGGGSGAFGTANVVGGVIQSVTITDPGSGFTSVPSVVANLPTFAIYTAGKLTDFTGNYSVDTPTALATRDIRPGLYMRGETSGALAQILTHTGAMDNQGNELFDVDIKYGSFQIGEAISYGDITKNIQITIFIESGIYEENFPLKVSQNVSLIGDEFRRVLVKPRSGPSSSPWAFDIFRRDSTIDSITTSTQLFARHYLTDPANRVYPAISNAGNYKAAAQLLYLNKQWFQEEIVGWIDAQIAADIEPFDGNFTFDTVKCKRDVDLMINAVMDDLVLGSTYRTVTAANAYLRSYSGVVTSYQKGQTLAAIKKVRDLVLNTIYGSTTYVASAATVTTLFNKIVYIIESGTPSTVITYTNPGGLVTDKSYAKDIIIANRTFIQNEVLGYITDQLNPGSIPGYDADKCGRDVGFIIDAMVYDLIYGGTSQTIKAGLAYYDALNATTVGGETSAFTSVLNQLKIILPAVISNQTSWTGKSASNTTSQTTTLPAASSSGVSATTLTSAFDIIKDIIINGVGAASAASPVDPTIDANAANIVAANDRTVTLAASVSIQNQVISYLNATYSPGTFTYNRKLCKRDVGLIVEALIFDLRYGGYNRTISAALKYFQSASALKAITDQLDQTVAAWNHLIVLTDYVLQNILYTNSTQELVPQIIDNAYIAEGGTRAIVTNLVNAIIDIVSGSTLVNLPKDNNKIDVFMMNDATMLRRMTAQGQGGFMMILDPAGQILAKSPYCQESASFIGSTGRKQFAGGMFVDGFAGNLEFTMVSKISSTRIVVTGLQRFPNLPASVIITGSVYRINYVRDWVYNVNGSTATFVFDPGTPYTKDVGVQTCTISNGSPAVITKVDHGLQAGATITFTTTGSLPTGLSVGKRYYVLLIGLGANSFQVTDTLGSITPVATTSAGSGTHTYNRVYELLMPGNRSMLSNDFTQVADLGYGVMVTNGGLTEAVSMFTYYCQVSYYSINGGQIRSIAGSSAHGVYALVAEGSDPLEVPTPTDLYYDLAQSVTCYYPSGNYANSAQGVIVYINNYTYVPLPNSELEVDHGSGILYRYPINSAYTGADLPSGVARLTLGSTTGASGLSGLYAQINDGTLMTVRQNQALMLTGTLSGVSVRPSTGLVLTEAANNVYRVLQFTDYNDPNAPFTCTISNASPAVVTRNNHGLLTNYSLTFSSTATLPTGITAGQVYYVINPTSNTFQISTVKGGGAVTTTSAGSGTFSYTPTGLTTTLLRENYQYISMTVYQPNDYATVETTATATAQTTATMTGSSISGTTLTVGTLSSGTISAGMVLSGGTTASGTYIVSNISGSGNGSTWTVSISQTVSSTTITGTSNQVTLSSTTGMTVNTPIKFGISTQATNSDALTNYITVTSTLGMVVNMPVSFTTAQGSSPIGGLTSGTTYYVSSIISGTQLTISATNGGSVLSVTTSAGLMNVLTTGAFGGITAGQQYYVGSIPSSGKITLSTTPHVTTTATATTITTASFTGSISSSILTVTNLASGTIIAGMVLSGSGIAANTYIVSGSGASWIVNTAQTVASTSMSATAYTVTVTNSGLMSIGQPIAFTGTGFGNIASGTQYYIAAIPSSTSLALSATSALTSIFQISNASGSIPGIAKHNPVTVSSASGTINTVFGGGTPVTISVASPAVLTSTYAHGLSAGDVVKLETSGTLPTGLLATTHYFVLASGLTTTSFTLSLTPGGTAIQTSLLNAGTHSVSKVRGRVGDTWFAVVALGPYDRSRAAGSVFNWKGVNYVITKYDPETVTNTAFGRVYVSQINLVTGVQSGVGLNDSVISYTSAITLKAGVRRGTTNANGTLTIRIALTRVTGHDLLDIGTGSYADTNYPNEIYGPAVNARNAAGEVIEKTVGRVFYVTTDQYGNFRVGPYFSVDQGTGKVSFSAAIALSNLDGLGFKRGVPISEFSTDSSFANNATDTVPTQNATRIYLERRLGLTHNGAVVDPSQVIPINTGGFLPLNGALKMKANLDMGNQKVINIANPVNPLDAVNLQSMTFANFQDFSGASIASGQLLSFTGTGFGAVNATVTGDITLSLNPTTRLITASVGAGTITNSKVSGSAAIDQSKLNMNAATTRTNATGINQAALGLASFDDALFVSTNGWITIKTNSLPLTSISQIASNTVLGNSSISTGNITAVNFTTVVDSGGSIKKSQYSTTGFLRRTGGTGTGDGDYTVVEMSAAYTGSSDNNKLINRDSSGNFSANEINVSKVNVDNNTSIDTATAGSGGYIRYYGWNSVGGILVQSGTVSTDNKSLYWNDTHQFKTKDGGTDAPITASSIQVTAITTGGNTNSGTITGRWTLTGTSPNESRLQATYSADLAENYEGDKEYEVGTVLVFGGEKEVTTSNIKGDTRVAGVVSNTAAYTMYEACPGFKNLVALQGRVPCKVVGKIKKGDILITSGIPGVAVAATGDVKVGTVVGKALKDYDSDHIGTVEIAVGRT